MNTYDVVVVGARPAGAATALVLARLGHRVLVLDRMRPGTDTLSTHALMRAGVLQLDRFGLLDRVVASGAPAAHRVTFHYGTKAVPIDLREPLYAPRRTVLDPLLVDEAASSGADVRFGVRVTDLRWEAGRVVGVRGTAADGRHVDARARVTVGADGLRSLVARQVGASTTHQAGAGSAFVYGYFEGVPADGYHWSFVPGSSAGIIPTNDGCSAVFVGAPPARFDELWRSRSGAIADVLAAHDPALAERVAQGRRVGRLRGFPGLPGWLRRPRGPGWALVGDAASFKDPITAHGLTDALRDAEYLGRAIDAGLSGTAAMDDALAGYERTRDEQTLPMLHAGDVIASYRWSYEEAGRVHREMSRTMQREVAALETLAPLPPRRRAALAA